MFWKMALAALFVAAATAMAPGGASAISPGGPTTAGQADGPILRVKDDDDDRRRRRHRHRRHHDDDDDKGPGIGGVILGLAYCTIQQQQCADKYDEDTPEFDYCVEQRGC